MDKLRNVITVLALALVLVGCQTTKGLPNPVADASRPETVGLALYGSYTIAEEFGAGVAENKNTMPDVKYAIKSADAAASPVVEQIPALAKAVQGARADIVAGGGSPNLLQTAIVKLNDWVSQAAVLIKNFTDAVQSARSVPSATPTGATTP